MNKEFEKMFGENNEGRFVLGTIAIMLLYVVFAGVVVWGVYKLLC